MQDTLLLWELFRKDVYEVYVSDIVLREIDRCNEEKLTILLDYLDQIEYNEVEMDTNTIELAGCDVIISWNFRHIVNVKTVKGVKVITMLKGYKDLLIYPPSVLLEEGDDDE